MALIKNSPTHTPVTKTETPLPAGSFEDEGGDTAVIDEPVTVAPKATPAPAPAPATAVAHRPTNAVSDAFKRGCVWDTLQDVLGLDMLEDLGFGAFPRITVDAGGFNRDKTTFLGERIEFQLESWNFVWLVTTGEKNNKEADKLIRNSYDGVSLSGGVTIENYIQQLKVDGYNNATTKKYVEMYGLLVARVEKGVRHEIAAEARKLAQVSVSPQSVKRWAPFILESRMRKNAGSVDGTVLSMEAERKTMDGNIFGVINFSAVKTA